LLANYYVNISINLTSIINLLLHIVYLLWKRVILLVNCNFTYIYKYYTFLIVFYKLPTNCCNFINIWSKFLQCRDRSKNTFVDQSNYIKNYIKII